MKETIATLLLIVAALLTAISIESTRKEFEGDRNVIVEIVDPKSSLISYECSEKVELRHGHWVALDVLEFENELDQRVRITYVSASWISGGEGIRVIGAKTLALEPKESKKMPVGFIVKSNSSGGVIYFTFLAEWENGSALINTKACPVEILVEKPEKKKGRDS